MIMTLKSILGTLLISAFLFTLVSMFLIGTGSLAQSTKTSTSYVRGFGWGDYRGYYAAPVAPGVSQAVPAYGNAYATPMYGGYFSPSYSGYYLAPNYGGYGDYNTNPSYGNQMSTNPNMPMYNQNMMPNGNPVDNGKNMMTPTDSKDMPMMNCDNNTATTRNPNMPMNSGNTATPTNPNMPMQYNQ